MIRLVHGVGINDTGYSVKKYKVVHSANGKTERILEWACPYYEKLVNMLRRCYSEKFQVNNPTYVGCSVETEWFSLSTFIKWVDAQPNRDWQNCQLDKDLLVQGNKIYGPTTCVFIPRSLNSFILEIKSSNGKYLVGASWRKSSRKFSSSCCDPFKLKRDFIGFYETELEAHLAWKNKKHEYACQLAELQSDERIAVALRNRYKPD